MDSGLLTLHFNSTISLRGRSSKFQLECISLRRQFSTSNHRAPDGIRGHPTIFGCSLVQGCYINSSRLRDCLKWQAAPCFFRYVYDLTFGAHSCCYRIVRCKNLIFGDKLTQLGCKISCNDKGTTIQYNSKYLHHLLMTHKIGSIYNSGVMLVQLRLKLSRGLAIDSKQTF